MTQLTRITISLENTLLEAFDRSIEAKGYPTRSEAIRDLIRDRLVREEGEQAGGEQVAVVTLVYDHQSRELAARLIDKQHHHHDLVVSTLHVHLGAHHAWRLPYSVVRPIRWRHLGNEMLATRASCTARSSSPAARQASTAGTERTCPSSGHLPGCLSGQ